MDQEPTIFELLQALIMGSSDARIVSAFTLSDDERVAARRERRLATLEGDVAIVLEPGTRAPLPTKPC